MFRSKTIIGLDIGTSSIKLTEIKKDKEEIQLVKARLIELTPRDRLNTAEAISRILKLEKIHFAEAIISVSGSSIFSRFVKLPKLTEQKLSQIVKYEAQQQIPFPLEEVVWDYRRLKSRHKESGQIDILLVAVKKDIVEELVQELYHSNLDIETIDVGPFALYNTLWFNDGFDNVIILDIGAKTTNIIISREGIVWTRSLPIAGDDITKAIAEGLNVSFEVAEERKKKEGIVLAEEKENPSSNLSNFITSVLTDLLTEVSRSIGYYKSQFDGAPFSGMLLTGGTSKLKNIDKFFEKNLKLKTYTCDFFKKIKPKTGLLKGDLSRYQHRLGTALGLALRAVIEPAISVNLIPPQLLRIKALKRKRKYIFGSGVLAIAFMLILNNQLIQKNKKIEEQLAEINAVLSEYQNFEKKIERVKLEIEPIEKRVSFFESLAQEKAFWLDMLSEITSTLDKDTWLTDISFKDSKTILIDGKTTGSFLTVTKLKEDLEKSEFFKEVETIKANLEKKEKETSKSPRIIFSLKATLEKRRLMFR
jgi:type IV pilus assembly protein PilM